MTFSAIIEAKKQMVALKKDGLTNEQIGRIVGLSKRQVQHHLNKEDGVTDLDDHYKNGFNEMRKRELLVLQPDCFNVYERLSWLV